MAELALVAPCVTDRKLRLIGRVHQRIDARGRNRAGERASTRPDFYHNRPRAEGNQVERRAQSMLTRARRLRAWQSGHTHKGSQNHRHKTVPHPEES